MSTLYCTTVLQIVVLLLLCYSLKGSAQIFTDGKNKFLDCKPFIEWNMDAMGAIRFHSPLFGRDPDPSVQYPTEYECQWIFRGTDKCTPVIYCDRDIQIRNLDNGTCEKEFLKIADGAGGANYYCGYIASKDVYVKSLIGKDLLVTFKTDEDPEFDTFSAGFSCTATCNGDLSRAKPLSKDKNWVDEDDECACGAFNFSAYPQNSEFVDEDGISLKLRKRLIGGDGSDGHLDWNHYPFMAAIIHKATGFPICGASIVADRYVLTAASCFKIGHTDRNNKNEYVVSIRKSEYGSPYSSDYLGQFNYAALEPRFNNTGIPIDKILLHPSFSLPSLGHDAALIKVSRRFRLNPNSIVCLSTKSYEDTMKKVEGTEATMVGYGFQDVTHNVLRRYIKAFNVPILPQANCTEMYKHFGFPEKKICAGALGGQILGDGCEGDTGNPLVVQTKGGLTPEYKQIGIHSFGLGCVQPRYTGTYTALSEISDWLKKTIECTTS